MDFNNLLYLFFVSLLAVMAIVHFLYYKTAIGASKITNPNFSFVQRSYLIPFALFIVSDWLQGNEYATAITIPYFFYILAPYLYDLYAKYGYQTQQIAIIYAAGLIASVAFGTFGQILPDYLSRCLLITLSAVVCSISAFMKLSSDYGVLIGSRILQGSASSILFMALSAWYGTTHVDSDFPREWLTVTFTKSTYISNIMAVAAGVFGEVLSQFFGFGPVSPSIFGILPLMLGVLYVMKFWKDNKGSGQMKMSHICVEGVEALRNDKNLFLLGCLQALVEANVYLLIFVWTPLFKPSSLYYTNSPSLGIVFSVMMLGFAFGWLINKQLEEKNRVSPFIALSFSSQLLSLALLAMTVVISFKLPQELILIFMVISQMAVGK